jgi:hypothetical protein
MNRPVGDSAKNTIDERRRELDAQWPGWDARLAKLEKAGMSLSDLRSRPRREERRNSWLAHVRPTDALVEHFSLAPEIAVLCAPWDETHAEDIEWIEERLDRESRLDPGVVLCLVGDHRASTRLSIPKTRRYIFVHRDEWDAVSDPQRWLRDKLRTELGAQRLFDLRSPAEGAQYFGRVREFAEVERYVLAGRSIGLWGLRKIGKTSLLRRLASKHHSPAADQPMVLLLDLTARAYGEPTIRGVHRALDAVLDRALCPGSGNAVERLAALVRARTGKVVLAIDEYERLLDGSIPAVDGVLFLEALRGLAQSTRDQFAIILAGRDRRFVATARIDGRDNPMYRFLTDLPVGGLDDDSAREMLRKLGRRMGLDLHHEALNRCVRETGGHPMLLRTLGDLIDRGVPVERRQPYVVQRAEVESKLDEFSYEAAEDYRELLLAAGELTDGGDALLIAAAHDERAFSDRSARSVIVELRRFGILSEDSQSFRIDGFRRWLSDNMTPARRAAHG